MNLFLIILILGALIFASIGVYTKYKDYDLTVGNTIRFISMFITYFVIFYPLVIWFIFFNAWLLIDEQFKKK